MPTKRKSCADLEAEIRTAKGYLASIEREIGKNREYQETGDENLIKKEIQRWDFYERKRIAAERALRKCRQRSGNPMARKKRKTKRKATPAQLRALAKGRATLRKKRRGKKATKKARRRNPAFSNYQKARSVARGSRRVNKVRKLSPLYVVKKGSSYFDGARFSKHVKNAARFVDLKHVKSVARRIADATGQSVRVFDLRA